jgi:hypothetical protein
VVVGAVVIGGVLIPVVVALVTVGMADALGGALTGGPGVGRNSAKIIITTPPSTNTAAPATRGRCAVSHAFTALTSTARVAPGERGEPGTRSCSAEAGRRCPGGSRLDVELTRIILLRRMLFVQPDDVPRIAERFTDNSAAMF